MSRAFVKEPDGLETFEDLPEKLVSEHPNLVTERGLALIEAEVERLSETLAVAQAANDRGAIARLSRDLRYWSSRRSTAELMPVVAASDTIQFGTTVTIMRHDGRRQTYRIVGEDEADPTQGTVSYVAPLAQALFGKSVGDTARFGAGKVEIIAIR
jgi:transcription elongation GreA/GreB family factor